MLLFSVQRMMSAQLFGFRVSEKGSADSTLDGRPALIDASPLHHSLRAWLGCSACVVCGLSMVPYILCLMRYYYLILSLNLSR